MKFSGHNFSRLQDPVKQVAEKCLDCGQCSRSCGYLQRFGLPGEQARAVGAGTFEENQSFLCSLCGLCTEVCPVDIDPAAMFMELRRRAVEKGKGNFSRHGVLTGYERRGNSAMFSWFGLPEGCDTIFYPGCALPGSRPQRVVDVYTRLRREIPQLGLVLDCCTKPSHDLGRQEHSAAMFGYLLEALHDQGVSKVLVACPNCFRMLHEYGNGLEVRTIYEVLSPPARPYPGIGGKVTVHDPCGVRQRREVHAAVRRLVTGIGLEVVEMEHHSTRTLCCGEGGAVGFLDADLSGGWRTQRSQEAGEKRIITYCAGCTAYLGRITPTVHLLDLLFAPDRAMAGRAKESCSPFTYLNRLKLKRSLPKIVRPQVMGRRNAAGEIVFSAPAAKTL